MIANDWNHTFNRSKMAILKLLKKSEDVFKKKKKPILANFWPFAQNNTEQKEN